MKDIINRLKRGYYKPNTLPIWKLIMIYLFWIVSLIGYMLSPIISLWLLIIGIVFQVLAMTLPIKWATGELKNMKNNDYPINDL